MPASQLNLKNQFGVARPKNLAALVHTLKGFLMAGFTTRVLLHDADWSDYDKLHVEMRRRRFTQTVTASDGRIYELPHAEYNYIGQATGEQVRGWAEDAVSAVRKRSQILVTESNGRWWRGLSESKFAAAH
jgi:hypothetical protein